MLAVDTNVVVRLLTADDQHQLAHARRLFASEDILLVKTVMLEAEWVLRRTYGFSVDNIATAFANLIALSNVRCEDLGAIETAIDGMRKGLDFADALHLASAQPAEEFATFDRNLAARARRFSNTRIMLLGQKNPHN